MKLSSCLTVLISIIFSVDGMALKQQHHIISRPLTPLQLAIACYKPKKSVHQLREPNAKQDRASFTKSYTTIVDHLTQQQNINLQHKDRAGNSAFHLIAQHRHVGTIKMLRLLLSHTDASSLINAPNLYKDTPLHCAIKSGTREILEAFLDKPSVDVTVKNSRGQNALELAIVLKQSSLVNSLLHHPGTIIDEISIVSALRLSGNKKEIDKRTRKIISSLLCFGMSGEAHRSIRKIFRTLCVNYADLKNRSKNSYSRKPFVDTTVGDYKVTTLMYAVGQGEKDFVRWLLQHQANPLLLDSYKKSVLNIVGALLAKSNNSPEQKAIYTCIARLLTVRILGLLGLFCKQEKDQINPFSLLPGEMTLHILCFLFGYTQMTQCIKGPFQRCMAGKL